MAQGSIIWHDLTVDDANEVRDFYAQVIGWEVQNHSMGDYNDYVLHAPDDEKAAVGVCHKRGTNASMPSQWLMYITVDNVKEACDVVHSKGGTVLEGPRMMGGNMFAVIEDPAGAMLAIIEG